jgi:transcription initiation factor TFIIIB Brf1 subunit/transcription initiation factor TFIIB
MADRCPECGGHILKAGHELVCGHCGRVVSNLELVPAIPLKEREPTIWDYASFKNSTLKLQGAERGEKDILLHIKHICNMLRLPPSVVGDACRIVRKLRRANIKIGLKEAAAVAVYCATRINDHATTMKSIAEAVGLPNGEHKLFSLVANIQPNLNLKTKPITPDRHIPYILAKISTSENYKTTVSIMAVEVAKRLWKLAEFRGRSPILVAAMALAFADDQLGGRIGLQQVSEASGISTSTLTNLLNRLHKPWMMRKIVPVLPPNAFDFVIDDANLRWLENV